MARGDLVTDDIVIGLIAEQLDGEAGRHGLIFDGFPRTLAQADALEALMAAKGKFLDAVDRDAGRRRGADRAHLRPLHLRQLRRGLPRRRRSRRRRRASATSAAATEFVRRADDNADAVRVRLMAYYRQTAPLIGYYHAKGKLRTVNGLDAIDTIAGEIKTLLGL